VSYYGGKVQVKPVIHLVFWGSNWTTEPGKKEREEYLLRFYRGLSKSPFQGILTQYFETVPSENKVNYISPTVKMEPEFIDTREPAPGGSPGAEVEQTRVAEEARYAVSANHWPRTINTQVVVLPAPGTKYTAHFAQFCAYHEYAAEEGTEWTFSLLPYFGELPFSKECVGYDSKGDPNHIASVLASHEYAESATDPAVNAWLDTAESEVGDICALSDRQLPAANDNGSWVQGVWDDNQSLCSTNDEGSHHVLGLSEPPTGVSTHEATLNAIVNPELTTTSYHFEYGPTTTYGSSTPTFGVGSGLTNQSVEQKITHLLPETTYHYRVVASNGSETADGLDQSFITAQWSIGQFDVPNEAATTEAFGVSCAPGGSCTAVGRDQVPSVGAFPYAQTSNGGRWTLQHVPLFGEGQGVARSHDVALDNEGNLWISDTGHGRVEEFSPTTDERLATIGKEGAGTGEFKEPWGIAIARGSSRNVWVADKGNNRIQEIKPTGEISMFGEPGSGKGQFREPQGVAVDAEEHVWIADSGNNRVVEYSPERHEVVAQIGLQGSGNGELKNPAEITIDSSGNVWVTDQGNNRVDEFSSAGTFIRTFGWGVQNGEAKLETCTSTETCQAGAFGYEPGELNGPAGITIDGSGHIWVVNDAFDAPVEEFKPETSGVKFVVGFGSFYFPWGAASTGNSLYTVEVAGNGGVHGAERWTLPNTEGPAPTFSGNFGASEPRGGLFAVSCATATACMGVGETYTPTGLIIPLADVWNGSTWAAQPVPAPASSSEVRLRGVSCVSASECVAVGFSKNSSGKSIPYAVRWTKSENGSSGWTEMPAPSGLPEVAVIALSSVSCASSTSCIAVGHSGVNNFEEGEETEFAQQWNGREWSVMTPTVPEGTQKAELTSVSCSSANACTADGPSLSPQAPTNQVYWGSVMERWNGTAWSVQSTPPTPVGPAFGGPSAVSCSTAESCTAVGGYQGNPGGIWFPLVETWNGTVWRLQRLPNEAPESEESGLTSVSCVAGVRCAAVGDYITSGSARAHELPVVRNEPQMAVQSTAAEAGSGILAGPSCASATACLAVGAFNKSGSITSVADEWNGLEWTPTAKLPVPAGGSALNLRRSSCTSSGEESGAHALACTAVGTYRNSAGVIATAAERWNGSEWKVQTPENQSNAKEDRLMGVVCNSSTSCRAVGYYKDSSGVVDGLAESWSGETEKWTIQTTEAPSGATGAQLAGVSCTSSASCWAVGSYSNGAGESLSLVERLVGSEWKVQSSANPSGGTRVELNDVSCAGDTSCAAAGSYTNSAGNRVALAEVWNGSEWQVEPVESPSGAVQSDILGVSCAPLGACAAVGWYQQNTAGKLLPFADSWSGREWVGWPVQSHSGSLANELAGVSCVSIYACEATGTYSTSTKTELALAEGLGAPGASTGAATGVSATGATLTGSLNPSQWMTSYYYEYGPTNLYGSTVPVSGARLPSEVNAEEAQQLLTNLEQGVTYHYRLVAENAAGKTYGQDRTFNVPVANPAVGQVQVNTGPTGGGTTVTISGTSFNEVTAVSFGSQTASFKVNSTRSITAVSPPGAEGTIDVKVTTPLGTSAANSGDHFTYRPPSGVVAWGSIEEGPDAAVPVEVAGTKEISAISAGDYHNLALGAGGEVLAWGANEYGELGNNSTQNSKVPVRVEGLGEPALAVAAGSGDSFAILKGHTVRAWGIGGEGELGNGTKKKSLVPVGVCVVKATTCPSGPYLSGVTAVSSRGQHTLALLEGGTVVAWGENRGGELGTGTTESSLVPVEVKGLAGVVAVAAGEASSYALLKNGTVMAWGYNYDGELGDGSKFGPEICESIACSTKPMPVSGLSEVTAIAAGTHHALALLKNGTVMSWGSNFDGQLGNGTETASYVPIEVSGVREATAIAASAEDSLALLSNDKVLAWGVNGAGQLGNGTFLNSDVPSEDQGIREATAVAEGLSHGLSVGTLQPAVAGVQPNAAPEAGGTSVTITGFSLSGATAVKFGSVNATRFEVKSANSIIAVAPPGIGTVDITVTTPLGRSGTNPADQFTWERTTPKYLSSFGERGSAAGQFIGPYGVAADSAGNIWIAEHWSNRIDEFSPEGEFKLTFGWGVNKNGTARLELCTRECQAGLEGSGAGELKVPSGVAVANGKIWVADSENSRVEEYTTSGEYVTQVTTLANPTGVAVDASGNVWVTSYSYGTAQEFSVSGSEVKEVTRFSTPFGGLEGIAIDPRGNVWVSSATGHRAEEYSPSGSFEMTLGWGVNNGAEEFQTCVKECQVGLEGSGEGQFYWPGGLAFDRQGALWVVDNGNYSVQRFGANGEYLSRLSSGGPGFYAPWGIAVSNGVAFVADYGDNRMERWEVSK
jgi:alpha-tubulin suppressor-like RCC1 family protein